MGDANHRRRIYFGWISLSDQHYRFKQLFHDGGKILHRQNDSSSTSFGIAFLQKEKIVQRQSCCAKRIPQDSQSRFARHWIQRQSSLFRIGLERTTQSRLSNRSRIPKRFGRRFCLDRNDDHHDDDRWKIRFPSRTEILLLFLTAYSIWDGALLRVVLQSLCWSQDPFSFFRFSPCKTAHRWQLRKLESLQETLHKSPLVPQSFLYSILQKKWFTSKPARKRKAKAKPQSISSEANLERRVRPGFHKRCY